MKTIAASLIAIVSAVCVTYSAPTQTVDTYHVVVANGRVIDPDSGLDAVCHVGISGGIIRAVGAEPLSGRTVVDASGLVVAPGFIDLHQHAQRTVNAVVDALKAMDGVTTALELEVGTDDIDRWYAARAGKSLILGAYVRDGHVLTLTDALRKMTIMPAARLERRVPAMKRKGRIQVGADGDVIAFDPSRIADRSTYETLAVASTGVVHALVNGVPIVRDGRIVEGAAPGHAVRAPNGGAETIQGRWKLIAAEDLRA
ncbi:MAG: hypothetical protein DMF98_00820, partial [Acidobacteria bacterium]